MRLTRGEAYSILGLQASALLPDNVYEVALESDVVLKAQHASYLLDYLEGSCTSAALLEKYNTLLDNSRPSLSSSTADQHTSSQDTLPLAVLVLNKAILLFTQHKYLSAVGLLEPLYSHIDSLDPGAAIRVCFLLIDIYLRFRQLSLANGVIDYLHQALPFILKSLSPQQATQLSAPGSSNAPNHTERPSTATKSDGGPVAHKNGGTHGPLLPPTALHVSTTDPTTMQAAKCSTPKLGAGGLMSHPVPLSQGPSPNTSITSQGQTTGGQDAGGAEARNGRFVVPVGFMGYVAALGVDLPAGQSATDGDSIPEHNGAGLQCAPGTAVLCLPYLSQLTTEIVQKAQQLQAGVVDELTRWEVDVKVALRVYKAQLHLLSNNTKAAKRELKGAAGAGASKQLMALMRAQLEVCRGNFVKASRMLAALIQDVDAFTSSPLQLLNNLGVLHHHLGQHQTAALYFSKALQQNSRQLTAAQGRQCATAAPGMDLSTALLYNAGLQQLMVKNYMLALKCFRVASCCYYHQPLLWLRLAECAVGVASSSSSSSSSSRDSCAAGPDTPADGAAPDNAKSGTNKRFSEALTLAGLSSLLDASGLGAAASGVIDALDPHDQAWAELHNTSSEGLLQYAQNCLDISLVLLDTSHPEPFTADAQSPHMSASRSVGSIDAALDSPRDASTGLGSPHPNGKHGDPGEEVDVARAAVLALSSYISLQQEQYTAALTSAKALLALPNLTAANLFLGVCYAAEALCRLGMPNDAMELLSQNMESMQMPERGSQSRPSLGNAGDMELLVGNRARSTMYANLAAVYITQGDLTAAAHCADQAHKLCSSHHTGLLMVYMELAQGNTSGALELLKSTAIEH